MTFGEYSKYYDLLYKDKDYSSEVDYIDDLINQNSSIKATDILDLGCGTGKHDFFLSQKDYKVTGVDLSEEMIKIAQQKYKSEKLNFIIGDAGNVRVNKLFDCVISLFHVASYQTTNEDLINYFKTANEHLKQNGLFMFDFWYGPAVLTDPPVIRNKQLNDAYLEIERMATPKQDFIKNTVNVDYTVSVKDIKTNKIKVVKESHKMRYLFYPELELLLNICGFKIINNFEWLKRTPLNSNNWNGILIAGKI
ncbi:MAG: class I SAM-dependent methyltransferase [Bacteroidales bacterium]|nr:class I SAM-dependent methyltransferase [Bacteroidales bacterium]